MKNQKFFILKNYFKFHIKIYKYPILKKGMNKPILPIDNLSLSSEEYRELRKGLEAEKLDKKTLVEIAELFGVGAPETGRISCDEYHAHSFECIQHYHPATAIIQRLLFEIQRYQGHLSGIQDTLNNALPKQS